LNWIDGLNKNDSTDYCNGGSYENNSISNN